MALTETRPDTDVAAASPVLATPATTTLDGILGSGDHKTIGRLWMGFGVFFIGVALVLAFVASLEVADLGSFAIANDTDQLTQMWSLGRDLLLFAGIVPVFIGIATYVVPLQVGSSSIAFPRGAAAAFWTWAIATDVLVLSYIMNGGPAGGRFDYVLLWTLALGTVIVSLLWAMVCIATTVLGARAAGMSLERVPATSWSFLVFSVSGLLALPVLLAELVLAYLDTKYGFLPTKADRTVLTAIVDSVSFAPALYWVGIPTLGIAVDVIGVHTGRPARFHKSILAVIGLYGFLAYGADLLSFGWRGRPVSFDNGLLVVAVMLGVVPVLLVLGLAGDSMGKGKPKLNTPLTAALLSGVLLLVASAASILGLIDPYVGFIETVTGENIDVSFDLVGTSFHDGIRGLVLGSAILGLIGAVHHWGHKIWGRSLDDRLGLLTVLAAAAGTATWGIARIVAGFLDQSRMPLMTEAASDAVEPLSWIAAIGTALLIGAAALLLLNMLGALAGRVGSSAEPWVGTTLEWATASPPISGNFADAPMVASATPLADAAVSSGAASDEGADQ